VKRWAPPSTFPACLFYGKTIAQEIEASRIYLEIQVPGTVTRIVGGTGTAKGAVFSIPLVDILVLQKPLIYQIVWKNE